MVRLASRRPAKPTHILSYPPEYIDELYFYTSQQSAGARLARSAKGGLLPRRTPVPRLTLALVLVHALNPRLIACSRPAVPAKRAYRELGTRFESVGVQQDGTPTLADVSRMITSPYIGRYQCFLESCRTKPAEAQNCRAILKALRLLLHKRTCNRNRSLHGPRLAPRKSCRRCASNGCHNLGFRRECRNTVAFVCMLVLIGRLYVFLNCCSQMRLQCLKSALGNPHQQSRCLPPCWSCSAVYE